MFSLLFAEGREETRGGSLYVYFFYATYLYFSSIFVSIGAKGLNSHDQRSNAFRLHHGQ